MADEELEFDPGTVICEKCSGIMRYRGSGAYMCEDCESIVLDDFGKVKNFLEKRGPSNIMEIAYATGLERSTVAKMLMDGRIQVVQSSMESKTCLNCGIPIAHGKYCSNCALVVAKRHKKKMAEEEKKKKQNDSSRMRFINVDTSKHRKKKK